MDDREDELIYHLSRKLKAGDIGRRQFLYALSVLGLSVGLAEILAACATGPQEQGAAGSVRFLVAESFWANWHPYLHTAQVQRRLEQQIFDHLVEIESNDFSKYSPGLAKSWKQLNDTTLEVALQQGVKFHKGQDFTADDVKASVELATGASAETENMSTAGRFVPTTVDVVDKHTARLKTKTPFAPLLNELSILPILSAADIKSGTAALKAGPNGTGPFKLVTDEKDKKTMEAFSAYWRGSPKIKTLVWEFIQDSQTRLNALLAGQAQAIDRVPPEQVQVIKNSSQVSLLSATGLENVNLWMRQDPPAPWDNPKVREAVAWSIDRESLVKNLVGGASEVAKTFLPNHAAFAVPQSPNYTFDPEKAKAAIAASGFTGQTPEFVLWGTTGFLPRSKEVVEAIADSLQKAGFRPKVTITDVAGIIDALFGKDRTKGLMFHLSWSSTGDPHAALSLLYHSPGAWSGAHDPKIDSWLDRGAATLQPDARAKIYADLQQYLWKMLPHIPLYNSDFTIAHSKSLSGIRALPNFMTYFYPASFNG